MVVPKKGDVYFEGPDLSQPIEKRINAIADSITRDPDYQGWESSVVRDAKLVSAKPGQAVFELEVLENMCNKGGNLHGGCATTILDNLTSCAILTIARKGFMDQSYVSRTITMTFLRPVPAGTKVRIVCEFVSGGKSLTHCKGHIETLDGKIAVTCTHDKAAINRGPKL